MAHTLQVIIIGGGVGGLTLALELHRHGINSRIYEAAESLEPLGVGSNILSQAARILDRLGLTPTLRATGVITAESVFYNRFGQLVYAEPAGLAAGYPWPQYSIHRGDFQNVLAGAVAHRLGNDSIVCDRRCVHTENTAGGVAAHLVSSDGAETTVEGDVTIGCDGVHSAIRAQLHPDEGPPVYSGINMWRGTVT